MDVLLVNASSNLKDLSYWRMPNEVLYNLDKVLLGFSTNQIIKTEVQFRVFLVILKKFVFNFQFPQSTSKVKEEKVKQKKSVQESPFQFGTVTIHSPHATNLR